MTVNNAVINFSANVAPAAIQKPVEFRYASDKMKQVCKPMYGVDNGKFGINFVGMTDVPSSDAGATKLAKVRNFSMSSELSNLYSAASFDLCVSISGTPYVIPDVWIGATTSMTHFPAVFSNWQGYEWIPTTGAAVTPMLAFPVGSDTPVVLGFKWVSPNDFLHGYMDVTVLERGITSGTVSTLTEINKELAVRYEAALLGISDAAPYDFFDVRAVLKDKHLPNGLIGRAVKDSFPPVLYITDAKFDESTLRLVKQSTEYVADALLVNDSSMPVMAKTADYSHKITNTHTFTRDVSSETSGSVGVKYSYGIDMKVEEVGIKKSVEVSVNFGYKVTDKTVDTWTTTDEKTYTFSGQSVTLPAKSSVRVAQAVSHGYLEGVIKAAVEIEKMYLSVAKFGLGPLQWQLMEVDIDALIDVLKLKTIKKTTTQVNDKPVARYHVDMSYLFSGDISTGMEYVFKDGDAE
jgi:hypothetical protein